MFELFEEFYKEQERKRVEQVALRKASAEKEAYEHQKNEHEKKNIELEETNIEETAPSEILSKDNELVESLSSELNNVEAFDLLIKKIRESSNTPRDYGTKFETLTKDWLSRDEVYKDLFTKIQTYKEWAKEHNDLVQNAKDTGIDLVATNADDGKFTAIQCKMYEIGHTVSKADIDSFISASDKDYYSKRFIVATNQKWTDNVLNNLKDKRVPVTVITHNDLASSTVDWSAYMNGKENSLKKRTLRKYQKDAIESIIVGLKDADRGKLIMACGTGKTFTSMKLVEQYVGEGGLVLFLVPSLSLLSQTLADWKRQCAIHINAFAVCSDSSTGKANPEDEDYLTSVDQLAYPATTNAKNLVQQVKGALFKRNELTVIFSTYQSIEVLHEAQFTNPDGFIPEFDLVICDEAHRTAGVSWVQDENESNFVKIHDNQFIKASKRLYMTATPRIYGSTPKQQAESGDLVLYSMDDESIFGKELATVSFTTAIDLHCLVDYKVIVLTVDESLLEKDYDFLSTDEIGGLSVNNAAKIVGTWRALTKIDLKGENVLGEDIQQMKRAVGFAQVIEAKEKKDRPASMQFAKYFNDVIEKYKEKEKIFLKNRYGGKWNEEKYNLSHKLKVESKHIDGSMNATDKDSLLTWLREEPDADTCKILFNVRCLSEGVDVPSLDAVIFLSPRKSAIDVVQIVGRVMRIAPGKQRGYVILPIVVPTNISPDLVLNKNKDFDVVWQILNALKSIDPTFGRAVDGETGMINSDRIEVISISDQKFSHKTGAGGNSSIKGKSKKTREKKPSVQEHQTDMFDELGRNGIVEETIKSCIVKKVGNRREWQDWAADVGQICQTQIRHIKKIIEGDPSSQKALDSFMKELKATLNGELTQDAVIEMLGQHVVIKPVLEAIFDDYPFAEENPISKAMTEMLEKLDTSGMKRCTALLANFYRDVRRRMANAKENETRQTIIKDLFDKFFKTAFPKMRDKLGIVYTPVEIVDFMNQSVSDLLKKEFNKSINDTGLHILDPFTGTGTFIVRFMQSGLISKKALPYKYENDIHANEIVPLAYYIAAMNMETAYHDIIQGTDYKPNNILVWTDTFASNSKSDIFKTALSVNNDNLDKENNADIRIIIGNPPYSVGQESQNDDNANEHYDFLDKRLQETYVDRSSATLKGKLFDSYIRAYRWASDRIHGSGIVAFITNAGWLDSASADGMRKCMVEEFNSIYIYHLKGNQRTSGERSRQEGGKIFGEGSRAPVAIVFLVKNPQSKDKGKIYFHTVDDYLTREQKLKEISDFGSIANMPWKEIVPDKHGDWLNQKDDSFEKFSPLFEKNSLANIFNDDYVGIVTSRDSYVYNYSEKAVIENTKKATDEYNKAVDRCISGEEEKAVIASTVDKISWSAGSKTKLKQRNKVSFSTINIRKVMYRPFIIQELYYEKNPVFVERPSKWGDFGKKKDVDNYVISVTGVGNSMFSTFMSRNSVDFQCLFNSQNFPLYIYENEKKNDGISDNALSFFKNTYGNDKINKEDIFYYIYGILHSLEYRTKYANNLGKELPRIPRVATYEQFKAFSDAGRKLADLHVNYESQPEYSGVTIKGAESRNYYVNQMKWGKIPGKAGNAAKDKSILIYNEDITISNIPLEAQEYVVNKKSALDWIVERACVSTDKKSGITNDFNQYGIEQHNPRYPLSLFLKIITVSLETMKIVKSLPKLEIHPLDN